MPEWRADYVVGFRYRSHGRRMEALTAAAVAALTVYDMCKALDRGIEIKRLRLLSKSGGKSGAYRAEA